MYLKILYICYVDFEIVLKHAYCVDNWFTKILECTFLPVHTGPRWSFLNFKKVKNLVTLSVGKNCLAGSVSLSFK